ncbi:hypothetical protein [Rhizobium sp. RAF56]|uniref:hypothetical protein n=1 Tax=Rhizobium sp. RAF56 TaxID=3233062 RepID=UPI003F9661DC
MWWRRRKNTAEKLPWYRAPGYSGNLTEAEKRQLDAFRMQKRHPAPDYDDIPRTAQMILSRLEIENYDLKQENAFSKALVGSLVGAAVLYVNHYGIQPAHSIGWFIFGALFVIVPWVFHKFQYDKISEEFFPRGAPPIHEELLKEWELQFIVHQKIEREKAKRDEERP